ncbi:MAG: hypothetical protein U9R17_17040, partial [Thermodesulfobacteriota bacterium]|nr:hypothetical protein [Thermodesulfobacteriota bacterium]
MATVDLTIDLAKITHNARKTIAICRPFSLDVVGVTKGVCGSPDVARAMIAGGIKTLGGCPRIVIFSQIEECEKNYRRYM